MASQEVRCEHCENRIGVGKGTGDEGGGHEDYGCNAQGRVGLAGGNCAGGHARGTQLLYEDLEFWDKLKLDPEEDCWAPNLARALEALSYIHPDCGWECYRKLTTAFHERVW